MNLISYNFDVVQFRNLYIMEKIGREIAEIS